MLCILDVYLKSSGGLCISQNSFTFIPFISPTALQDEQDRNETFDILNVL